MNTAVQSFVKKPTSALQSLWGRLKPTNKYRVAYAAQTAPGVKNETVTEHESVEDGLNETRQNLDEVFTKWLEGDRDKSLTITVAFKDKTETQGLQIVLPAPASFVPAAPVQ